MPDINIPLTDNGPEADKREGFVIVKVQLPIGGEDSLALVYEHGRANQRLVPVSTVADRMRGRPKAYFYAKAGADPLVLGDEAPEQAW
jgi:hypothetical protein